MAEPIAGAAGAPLLQVSDLSVSFGGHIAVDHVSLHASAGRITGLIGPNGAGKTTTFNALCGLQSTTNGTIRIGDTDITKAAPHKRARQGLARTFQRLETFSLLSVRENVLTGAEFRRTGKDDPEELTDQLLRQLGLLDVADERVDSLPTGRARLVEVGRALASRPRLLLLDEPSSGLNESETKDLAEVLRFVADAGLAVLMVEHDMSLVMGSCEEIHVLDFGRIIASGSPAEVQADPAVRAAYLGDDDTVAEHISHRSPISDPEGEASTPVLSVRDLAAGYGDFDVVEDVEFDIAAGEVFALLGPNGAGKTTVLQVIAGLVPASRGSVAICGRNILGADADALARAGLCTVPEGRGIFPNLSVAENLWMASYAAASRSEVEEAAFARFPRLAERRTQTAGTMSGGEQQMLAMARALATDPALLILDELSMGLAPLIVADLYERVAEIAASGLSILVVEQFAHEVLGVADTAAIMLHGRIQRIGPPAEINAELEAAYLSGAIAPA